MLVPIARTFGPYTHLDFFVTCKEETGGSKFCGLKEAVYVTLCNMWCGIYVFVEQKINSTQRHKGTHTQPSLSPKYVSHKDSFVSNKDSLVTHRKLYKSPVLRAYLFKDS